MKLNILFIFLFILVIITQNERLIAVNLAYVKFLCYV